MNDKQAEQLRALPSVSTLLETELARTWSKTNARADVTNAIRQAVEQTRERILANGEPSPPVNIEDVLQLAEDWLTNHKTASLRPVINATGIVLHTGLGRAPLSSNAIDAIVKGASGYCNLEYDVASGARGRRLSHVSELLCKLTGAQAATVVNNNAAALVLIMRTFCENREVIVSRGQLVEIGGSFRLPEMMSAGGAILKEVGTTNRTNINDFQKAITENTSALLHVNRSNFRMEGFTHEPNVQEFIDCAHQHKLLTIHDQGSGSMFESSPEKLSSELGVGRSLEAGFDLVCFSGDKLLGGPQAGIIVGRSDLISQIERHQLMRTYRVDKLILLALEATLRQYSDHSAAIEQIPTLAMLCTTTTELEHRAQTLTKLLSTALPDENFMIQPDTSYAGGGSLPGEGMETVVIAWRPSYASVNTVAAQLRQASTPVVARVKNDQIIFDLRTIPESDFARLSDATSATAPCAG